MDKTRSGGRNLQHFCSEEILNLINLFSRNCNKHGKFNILNALNVFKTVQVFNKGHIVFHTKKGVTRLSF